MRRYSKLTPIALAALLLSGCGLLSPAASSVNSSVISQAWLDEAVSYFIDDPALQKAANLSPPQVTDPTGQVQGTEISREALERQVLEREIVTQLFESETYKRGLDPNIWIERNLPRMEQAVRAQYVGQDLPPEGAIRLLNRWTSVPQAFVTASTGLPEQATLEAVATVFEKLPIAGRKICMSVIGVSSQEKLDQVVERLAKKESFTAVAADLSDHLPSKPRKGDVGCVTISQANQLFQEPAIFQVASETPPGTSTGPFQGSSGLAWWVRVADTGSTGTDLESATPQIVEQYSGARGALAQEEYVRVMKESDIRVVCPIGRWFDSGPYAENPLLISCDEEVPQFAEGDAVEVNPGAQPAG